jgi:hypothetical protein
MGIPVEADGMVNGACDIQTSVPILRLSQPLRVEEDRLAEHEARLLEMERRRRSFTGEESLLPYGFIPESS